MPIIFNPTGYVVYKYEGEPKLFQKHIKILNLIYGKLEARSPWECLRVASQLW